jgi:hypothetical protein
MVAHLLRADRSNGTLIGNTNVMEGLVAVMRAHPTSDQVAIAGITAMALLAETNRRDLLSRLVNAGAVEALKDTVQGCPGNERVREYGNRTLVSFRRHAASMPAIDPVPAPAPAVVPAPLTVTSNDSPQPKTAATTTDIIAAPTIAKPVHMCVSSCCGKAAMVTCAECGLVWYCSREHQTGHWKQHKEVCKATDDESVKCRRIARFLAVEPVDSWQPFLTSWQAEATIMTGFVSRKSCESLIALGVCETLAARVCCPWEGGVPQLVRLFSCLIALEEGAKRLSVACTFDLLEELYRVHLKDEKPMFDGCTLVVHLVGVGENGVRISSTGIPEGVVAAIRAHQADGSSVMSGCIAIERLAHTGLPDIPRKLVDAGAADLLEDLSVVHTGESSPCIWSLLCKSLEILLPFAASAPAAAHLPVPPALAAATAPAITKGRHLCVSSCCGKAAKDACAGCGLVWYCSREHQTGHWKQHKKVCKATDDESVRCREIARFLAVVPVDRWKTFLRNLSCQLVNMTMCEALIALGVCETLMARACAPWQPGVPELVHLFGRLANVEDGAKRLAVPRTFELFEVLFRMHVRDENAIMAGCSMVSLLLNTDPCSDGLMGAGVVEGVVAAMHAHRTSTNVVAVGTMAISMFAKTGRADVLARLVAAGAIEALRGAMLSFPNDPHICGAGAPAVQRLVRAQSAQQAQAK